MVGRVKHVYTGSMVTFLLASGLMDAQYFGVYLQGQRVGYALYESSPVVYAGKSAERSHSLTVLKIGLIGSEVEMKVDSETITVANRPVRMKFVTSSAGRTQTVEARFTPSTIEASINNNGAISKNSIPLPKDAKIYDDPVTALQAQPGISGKEINFYIFDPSSVALMKNRAFFGEKEDLDGASIAPVVVEDPRLTTKVYLSSKGDILKVGTSIGVDMRPLPKSEALAEIKETGTRPDLAEVTAIRPTPSIKNPQNSKFLKLKLSADNLKSLATGDFQNVEKAGSNWIVSITQPAAIPSQSIAICAKAQPTWLKASHLIPSDNPTMVALAKKIVGSSTNSAKAAEAIRRYVNSIMTPDAGIGILRDASEVLKTKVGVCRDYAILTATLCRAAKLPTKLASGLVSFDGTFYYHAWVEVFTGSKWVPYDSIPSSPEFSATHVKLSQGNVDTAFAFTVLSGAKIEVLEQK